jgi:tetratricopeptide (TPR) repeat protein
MKKTKRTVDKADKVAARRSGFELRPWHYMAALAAALVAALEVYGPALRGAFVFDDSYLPFTGQEYVNAPLRAWLGVRPLLMFTFWANFHLYGTEPFSYHMFNVLGHLATSALVFLAARKLLSWAGASGFTLAALAAFAAGLFLLHPVQTESVAYVTSRSEVLSVLLFHAAFVVYLYRRSESVSWITAVAVLLLFGLAASTKEHAAIMPLFLLLTDYYWNPGFSFQGIRRNWRLYALFVVGGALAARMIARVLASADTAGFSLKEFTWYQYFFTQCRVIWDYIRLFFLPYGQTVDYDYAVSRTIFERGAIIGLIGLVALAVAAFYFRRRYPLASYGYFAFLLLLAPTSSVMPIADPIAERRMYLPIIGLILVVLEFLRRWKTARATLAASLAAVLCVAGALTYQRSKVWAGPLPLWEDAALKSPRKQRVQFQLGFAYFTLGRCAEALRKFETAARLGKPDYRILVDWGLAYDCLNRREEALAKLREAAAVSDNAHVNSLIGLVYIKDGKREEAMHALDTAARIDPAYDMTYVYRGALYASTNDWQAAMAQYQHALKLNRLNDLAREGIAQAERALRGRR